MLEGKSISERLVRYFESSGYQPILADCNDDHLTFAEGQDKIVVRIIQSLERSQIISALMALRSTTPMANRVFFAIRKEFAPFLDAKIFENAGVGLIDFNDRTIEQVCSAKRFEIVTPPEERCEAVPDGVAREIEYLKDRCKTLEFAIEELRHSVRDLTAKPPALALGRPIPPLHEAMPALFEGNPWLQVLARRGVEDESHS